MLLRAIWMNSDLFYYLYRLVCSWIDLYGKRCLGWLIGRDLNLIWCWIAIWQMILVCGLEWFWIY